MRLRPTGPPLDPNARVDRAVAWRAWQLGRPYRRQLALFLVTVVAGSTLMLVPPLIFRSIIDDAIPRGDTRLLTTLFAAIVAVALSAAAISLVERYQSASIGEGLIRDLRIALFDHVQRLPLAFFTRTQTGALLTRMNNDVIGAQRALTGTLGSIVQNAISLTLTLAVMTALEWRVTLLALVLVPGFTLPARWVGRRLQALTRESMRLDAEMNSTMTERFNVSGALLVKLFGRPEEERELVGERVDRVARIGVRTALHGRVLFVSLGLIGALATALVYLVGGRLAIEGALTVGTVVALATYVTQLYGPLTQLTNARVDLMTALVSFERVFEVLDLPVTIEERPDAVELTDAVGHVRYEDVTFRYPASAGSTLESLEGPRSAHGHEASEVILAGVSFEAPPGATVAIVGPSGAGKTTLAALLPRLYDVTDGRISIDGVDLRDLTLASLRRAIGVVTQDPHLFHDSVAANLRYAKPDASDAELVAACVGARIHDVIAALPDGYETVVGERGYRLSGGEKQRLAIARVLLKDPAIVILDEATAHLDSEAERLVQAALRETLRGRTSLVIAHRLSTVVDADHILVIDGGRIVERGRHADLLAAGGLYADLARGQLSRAAV